MATYGILLTPEAVHAVLARAGLQAAEIGRTSHPLSDGFYTCRLPVTVEDRVAVMWHADPYGDYDRRAVEEAGLSRCTTALHAAGYQAEFVNERASDYLVVWVEGEF